VSRGHRTNGAQTPVTVFPKNLLQPPGGFSPSSNHPQKTTSGSGGFWEEYDNCQTNQAKNGGKARVLYTPKITDNPNTKSQTKFFRVRTRELCVITPKTPIFQCWSVRLHTYPYCEGAATSSSDQSIGPDLSIWALKGRHSRSRRRRLWKWLPCVEGPGIPTSVGPEHLGGLKGQTQPQTQTLEWSPLGCLISLQPILPVERGRDAEGFQ
jgi:hypothetical protein